LLHNLKTSYNINLYATITFEFSLFLFLFYHPKACK
jgi:uncharacterized protein with PQ loop repeat